MGKNNAYLKDENLLTLFSLNNLIVPEIQREYVWGNNNDVLKKFLEEIKNQATLCEKCHHVHSNKNINVGFLYSYKPSYVKYESERILDEFLIDGQQRITTLFLLLLYRASIEGRIDDFIAICRADEIDFNMGFNYKVRNLTQQFLMQLIQYAKNEGSWAFDFILDLENSPCWFLDDYRNDPTIKSMISALRTIKGIFGSRENYYYDYLLRNIHFWHFKTEATSQGEELYITMNSRGEQLTDNEMQKSRSLPSSDLLKYGTDWEKWQIFFWRNRKKGNANNPNADKGFNNFLACIEGLEKFNKSDYTDSSRRIETISLYMNALIKICSPEFTNIVKEKYSGLYTAWFDKFIDCLWNEINNYDGKWDIINPRGGEQNIRNDYNNKSIARNKTMLFWSWMMYFKKCEKETNDDLLIRILHFYYVRYNCFKRSTTSINLIIDCFITTEGRIHQQESSTIDEEEEDNSNSKVFSDEEILLSRFYYSNDNETKKMESLIWEIQDLPYFIDGKGVGGNTIYDYFSDNDIIDENHKYKSIENFKTNFLNILGYNVSKCSHIDIKRILLFYEYDNRAFWVPQSPPYYNNYETSIWKRIVRTKHFIAFYKEFTSKENNNLNEFLQVKRNEFLHENKDIDINGTQWSHRKLAILYDLLSDGIWDDGHENIVFVKFKDGCSEKEIFSSQDTIWKATRYKEYQISLNQSWKDKLSEYGVSIKEDISS